MDLSSQVKVVLREADIKLTQQRLEIGMLLLAGPCHWSADQIYARLLESGCQVSKATVYNTLHLFSKRGIVRELALDQSRQVYDSTTEPHHHFYNVDSGELTDIDCSELIINKLPRLPAGTRAQSIELIVRVRNN